MNSSSHLDAFAPLLAATAHMAGFTYPWFVSGGWAIDLLVDRVTREHSDIEIGILREHQRALRAQARDRRWTKSDFLRPEGAAWVPWDEHEWVAPPLFQVQLWGASDGEPELDIFLNDTVDGAWQFRREPTITRPVSEIVLHSRRGVPFLAPDVQLAFKAKHRRPKDEQDFATALPHLSPERRAWLAMALEAAYGAHAWIEQLQTGD